jgi:hypothetical protein
VSFFVHGISYCTARREIHWGDIWEEIQRERERGKEIEGKDRRKEGKRQRKRDRGKETEGKRDSGEERG